MTEERWQLVAEHVHRVSHFMTNYRKKRGLDCNIRHDFSECVYVETERRERMRQSRGLMVFCHSSITSEATPGIYFKKRQTLAIVYRPLTM